MDSEQGTQKEYTTQKTNNYDTRTRRSTKKVNVPTKDNNIPRKGIPSTSSNRQCPTVPSKKTTNRSFKRRIT